MANLDLVALRASTSIGRFERALVWRVLRLAAWTFLATWRALTSSGRVERALVGRTAFLTNWPNSNSYGFENVVVAQIAGQVAVMSSQQSP
jgi:hypothetical protein